MRTTPTNWNEEITKTVRRLPQIEIEHAQIDLDAQETAVYDQSQSTTKVYFSTVPNRIFKKTEEEIAIGSLEQNGFLLDGTTFFPPQSGGTTEKVALWHTPLSDANGAITTTTTAVCNENINAIALLIEFSPKLQQYAIDFDVVIGSETHQIRGNNKIVWVSDFPITGTNKVKIVVRKWCNPYSRVKINKIQFGIYTQFHNNDLINFKMTEKYNPTSTQLSEEIAEFTYYDNNKEYNPFNLLSKQNFISKRQPVTIKMGYNNEYFDVVYKEVSGKPKIDNGKITLTASSLIYKLDKMIDKKLFIDASYYDILTWMFDEAGIRSYVIDSTLELESITTIIGGRLRDILTDMLIATKRQYWQSWDTVYVGIRSTEDTYLYITSSDQEKPRYTYETPIKSYKINYVNYTLDDEISEVFKTTPKETGRIKYTIKPAINLTVTGCTKISNTLDTITVDVVADTPITVNGKAVIEAKSTFIRNIDEVEEGTTIEVSENCFINTAQKASSAAFFLNEYYSRPVTIETNWRQNASVEAGDYIHITTEFGNTPVIVEENTINISMANGMNGTTKGRSV